MGTVQRFKTEMARLGHHPDRQIIRDLTIMADKGRHRAADIVDVIQGTVLSVSGVAHDGVIDAAPLSRATLGAPRLLRRKGRAVVLGR
jgi:hypothetical protein